MRHFQQLRQISGIRFKPGMKIQVVGMFDWDERTLHVELLAKKKHSRCTISPREEASNGCYFFEKLFDLMLGLGLDKNLSSNAGFETFTGDWNKAQKTCRRGNL